MSVDGVETTLTKIGPVSSPTCVSGVNGDMVTVTKQGVWSLKTANGHQMKFPKTLDLRGSSYMICCLLVYLMMLDWKSDLLEVEVW